MANDIRAFLIAVAVFVVLTIAYFVLVTTLHDVPKPLDTVVLASWWTAPLLSGFVCGYLVRHQQFAVLLTLGVVGAACVGGINSAVSVLGLPTDFGGVRSLPLVVGLSLLTILPLVIIGGAVGAKLRNGLHA